MSIIVRQGPAKKAKKDRYLVLSRSERNHKAKLEIYDKESQAKKHNHRPRQTVLLADCISIRPCLYKDFKYCLILFTNDENLVVVFSSEWERDSWLRDLKLSWPIDKQHVETVFAVKVRKEGWGEQRAHSGCYHLFIEKDSIKLVKTATTPKQARSFAVSRPTASQSQQGSFEDCSSTPSITLTPPASQRAAHGEVGTPTELDTTTSNTITGETVGRQSPDAQTTHRFHITTIKDCKRMEKTGRFEINIGSQAATGSCRIMLDMSHPSESELLHQEMINTMNVTMLYVSDQLSQLVGPPGGTDPSSKRPRSQSNGSSMIQSGRRLPIQRAADWSAGDRPLSDSVDNLRAAAMARSFHAGEFGPDRATVGTPTDRYSQMCFGPSDESTSKPRSRSNSTVASTVSVPIKSARPDESTPSPYGQPKSFDSTWPSSADKPKTALDAYTMMEPQKGYQLMELQKQVENMPMNDAEAGLSCGGYTPAYPSPSSSYKERMGAFGFEDVVGVHTAEPQVTEVPKLLPVVSQLIDDSNTVQQRPTIADMIASSGSFGSHQQYGASNKTKYPPKRQMSNEIRGVSPLALSPQQRQELSSTGAHPELSRAGLSSLRDGSRPNSRATSQCEEELLSETSGYSSQWSGVERMNSFSSVHHLPLNRTGSFSRSRPTPTHGGDPAPRVGILSTAAYERHRTNSDCSFLSWKKLAKHIRPRTQSHGKRNNLTTAMRHHRSKPSVETVTLATTVADQPATPAADRPQQAGFVHQRGPSLLSTATTSDEPNSSTSSRMSLDISGSNASFHSGVHSPSSQLASPGSTSTTQFNGDMANDFLSVNHDCHRQELSSSPAQLNKILSDLSPIQDQSEDVSSPVVVGAHVNGHTDDKTDYLLFDFSPITTSSSPCPPAAATTSTPTTSS